MSRSLILGGDFRCGWQALSVVGLVLAGFVLLAIRHSRHSSEKPAPRPEKTPAVAQRQDAIPADIVHFCGNCHATPDPMTFPRQAWEEEVLQGYEFYKAASRPETSTAMVGWTSSRGLFSVRGCSVDDRVVECQLAEYRHGALTASPADSTNYFPGLRQPAAALISAACC